MAEIVPDCNPSVGVWPGETVKNHITVIPLYDKPYEADDTEMIIEEFFDCHFFIKGDFIPTKKAAKTALCNAGLVVEEYRYIECTDLSHHFVLTVIGQERS